ncbi:MAG: hypothetical protein AB1324_01590 [Candidatus Micrarchaeota archaeon]
MDGGGIEFFPNHVVVALLSLMIVTNASAEEVVTGWCGPISSRTHQIEILGGGYANYGVREDITFISSIEYQGAVVDKEPSSMTVTYNLPLFTKIMPGGKDSKIVCYDDRGISGAYQAKVIFDSIINNTHIVQIECSFNRTPIQGKEERTINILFQAQNFYIANEQDLAYPFNIFGLFSIGTETQDSIATQNLYVILPETYELQKVFSSQNSPVLNAMDGRITFLYNKENEFFIPQALQKNGTKEYLISEVGNQKSIIGIFSLGWDTIIMILFRGWGPGVLSIFLIIILRYFGFDNQGVVTLISFFGFGTSFLFIGDYTPLMGNSIINVYNLGKGILLVSVVVLLIKPYIETRGSNGNRSYR